VRKINVIPAAPSTGERAVGQSMLKEKELPRQRHSSLINELID